MIGTRLGSALWWGLVPLLILLWGTGALTSGAITGLPMTPLATLIAAPAVGYLQDVALALALGCLISMLWADSGTVRRWATGWALLGVGLAAAGAAALQSDVTAASLGADPAGLLPLLVDTAVGRAILVQLCCLALSVAMIGLSAALGRRWPTWCAAVLVAAAIAAPPFAGHAGVSSEHQVAGASTALHAVAISLWVGGLAVVSARCLGAPDQAPVLLPRFSLLALVCVVIAAQTGLLSATLTASDLPDLLGSTYGSLILAKAVLLAWLIHLGWLQRRRAMDRLGQERIPVTVARMAGIELVLMGSAIAIAVVLVRIGPSPIPMTGLAPVTVVSLGLAAPMLLAHLRPARWRPADAWPEATMAAFLVVLVQSGGVGLLGNLAGGLGLAVELALVMVAGWLAMTACRRSSAATIIGLVGVPAALVANAMLVDTPDRGMTLVAALLAEALLVAGWLIRRRIGGSADPVDHLAGPGAIDPGALASR